MKDALEFNVTYNNIEIRACPKRLARISDDDINETIDVVKWNEEHTWCYSIAYLKYEDTSWEIRLLPERFFADIDKEDMGNVMMLIQIAWNVLNSWSYMQEIKE